MRYVHQRLGETWDMIINEYQGRWIQDSSRRLGHVFGVDRYPEIVHVGILRSLDGETSRFLTPDNPVTEANVNRMALGSGTATPSISASSSSLVVSSRVSSPFSRRVSHSVITGKSIQTQAVRLLHSDPRQLTNICSRYLPSCHLPANHLGHLRFERRHRSISDLDSDSHALGISAQAVEEGRSHRRPQRRCIRPSLRNTQGCLCPGGKFTSHPHIHTHTQNSLTTTRTRFRDPNWPANGASANASSQQ